MEFIFPALLIALIYFGLLRPQRNRVKKAQQLQNEIAPGQQVMTAGGLFGTVVAVDDEGVDLEIAPGVTTRWVRQAIGRVVTPAETLGLEETADEDQDSSRRSWRHRAEGQDDLPSGDPYR